MNNARIAASSKVNEAVIKAYALIEQGVSPDKALFSALQGARPLRENAESVRQYRHALLARGWAYDERDVTGVTSRPQIRRGWVSPEGNFFTDDWAVCPVKIRRRVEDALRKQTDVFRLLEIADLLNV